MIANHEEELGGGRVRIDGEVVDENGSGEDEEGGRFGEDKYEDEDGEVKGRGEE